MATQKGRRRVLDSRPRVTFLGVVGELLMTAGVIVMAYLGWQVWLNPVIQGNAQSNQAQVLAQNWSKGEAAAPAPVERPDPGPPPVVAAPDNAAQFGVMIIPRMGADYARPIAQGVGLDDVLAYGVGHYPETQMPGEVGNAAFAAHRTGHGDPFFDIDKLRVGDSIYIEMEVGWYRYAVRSLEYVPATGVEVLLPVPQSPSASATDRLITLTSCNPIHTSDERIIVYGVYDTWYPRAGGPPPEIAALVQARAGG